MLENIKLALKENRKIQKKAIFLDRDGVINKDKGYVHTIEDFELEKYALKGLKLIDFNKYLVFIVCNQAGIARGYYDKKDFKNFDSWIQNLLLKNGIRVAKTFYCPHHPQAETPKFRKKCSCRQPEICLLLKAQREFNINLKKSYLIGDKTSDILAGKRAGCKTILVKTGYGGKDKLFSVKPDFIADLFKAIKIINKVVTNFKSC